MPIQVPWASADYVTHLAILRAKARVEQNSRLVTTPSSLPDPESWLRDVLAAPHYYSKQVEILDSLRHHDRVTVTGANSIGKDWTTGRAALYWLSHLDPSKVIIVGPTYRQVFHVVWMEALSAYRSSAVPLGGKIYDGQPYLLYNEQRFALGFSTDKASNWQGFHSPHLLVIITEAHGMKQQYIDMVKRLNPECILMTGNSISTGGEFFDSFHDKANLWHQITITSDDSPNVIEGREVIPGLMTKEDVERFAADWGVDSPLYRMVVNSEWCGDATEMVVVSLSMVKRAESLSLPPGPVEVVACDLGAGRGHGDKTVIYSRRGPVARLLHRSQSVDTMQVVGLLAEYHSSHKNAFIVVDGVGLGIGVVTRLRELGVPVIDFNGGLPASNSSRYANRNAEVYWRMREAFEDGILDIEPDPALSRQLSTRKYQLRSDRVVQIESKEVMRAEGRKSPDEADALAMTFAIDWLYTPRDENAAPQGMLGGHPNPFGSMRPPLTGGKDGMGAGRGEDDDEPRGGSGGGGGGLSFHKGKDAGMFGPAGGRKKRW